MDMNLSAEELAFQQEVRSFCEATITPELKSKSYNGKRHTKEDVLGWQRALASKGWLTPSWPVEHGGCDWTPFQHLIFEEEAYGAGAPRLVVFGISMIGPVLIQFASDEMKKEHLPGIQNSTVWWCQGFSEPGAGSDLASLKTKAVREGDHYIVNGQKTWTTMAQHADWIFCLVKTDPDCKPQAGITMLLIDMKSPGVEVRPIQTMDGGHEVNEVFLDNVKVPVENLVGEENKGWTYAKFLLGNERKGIAEVGLSKRRLEHLKSLAKIEQAGGRPMTEDPDFARRIAEVEINLLTLEMMNLRLLNAMTSGSPPLEEAAMLKIKGTEIQQGLTELTMAVLGPYSAPFQPAGLIEGWNEELAGPEYAAGAAPAYFNMRKSSIYGGSNEVQRQIIAKTVLSA